MIYRKNFEWLRTVTGTHFQSKCTQQLHSAVTRTLYIKIFAFKYWSSPLNYYFPHPITLNAVPSSGVDMLTPSNRLIGTTRPNGT